MSSSVFASRVTKIVPVGEHSVTIRKLAPKHLGAAERAQQFKSIDDLKGFGGMDFIKELQALGGEKKKAAADEAEQEAQRNPLSGYDRSTLLAKGIVAWTFTDEGETVAPIDETHIDDLDDELSEMLAREILQLSRPALFADAEVVAKNA